MCSLASASPDRPFGPVGDGRQSRIWLLVNEDQRLAQMMKQVGKLEDVMAIRRHNADHAVFQDLESFFRP